MSSKETAAVRTLTPGVVVSYHHPEWGLSRGRVLRVGLVGVLVQDLHEHGAREWWPTCDVTMEEGTCPLCQGKGERSRGGGPRRCDACNGAGVL